MFSANFGDQNNEKSHIKKEINFSENINIY
jgi:hypothetical protein